MFMCSATTHLPVRQGNPRPRIKKQLIYVFGVRLDIFKLQKIIFFFNRLIKPRPDQTMLSAYSDTLVEC